MSCDRTPADRIVRFLGHGACDAALDESSPRCSRPGDDVSGAGGRLPLARRRGVAVPARRQAPAVFAVALIVSFLASATPVLAIPAFARKYGTSCLTCHTIYPKLTPFGEAFRRDGYRFPGIDSDFVKEQIIALGQEAYKKEFPKAVWPGTLASSVPIAIGFNGQAVIHPDKQASAAKADNGAGLNLHDLVEEGHVWAGGSFDDRITFFGEVTFAEDASELEHVNVQFNDLAGPKHAMNFAAGKLVPTISAFGPHSSYVDDLATTPLLVTALYGATSDSWNVDDAYGGLELNGTARGRLVYSVGANAGANVDTRTTDDYYAHVGYKFGGMRLDGEGSAGLADPTKPWAENAVTLDAFWYRSVSRFTASDGTDLSDEARAFGGAIRAQRGSLELNVGMYQERHDRARAGGIGVRATASYAELSYVYFPWLVPAFRAEYLLLDPDGGPRVTDTRLVAGLAALVRPNLKLLLTVWSEKADGAPDGGWGPASGLAVPSSPTDSVGFEVEAVTVLMAYAF